MSCPVLISSADKCWAQSFTSPLFKYTSLSQSERIGKIAYLIAKRRSASSLFKFLLYDASPLPVLIKMRCFTSGQSYVPVLDSI